VLVSRSSSGMEWLASGGGYLMGDSVVDSLATSQGDRGLGGVGWIDDDAGRTTSGDVGDSSGGMRVGVDVGGVDKRLAWG